MIAGLSRRSVPSLAGWISVVLGGVVLFGWFVQIPWVIKPSWAAHGMAFDTALCFVLAGSACVLTARGSTVAARLPAVLAALVSVAALLATWFGYDLNIATWLGLPDLTGDRMSPFTALAILPAAIVFLFIDQGRKRYLASEAMLFGAAETPLVLGLIRVLAAGLGLLDLTPWGPNFAAMALTTAFGLIVLGAGCVSLVLARTSFAGDRPSRLARPTATLVAIALVSWVLFDSMLAIVQQRATRTRTIVRLVQTDDAAGALELGATTGATGRLVSDYNALASLASGSQFEAAVKAMRAEVDEEARLLQSGSAIPSTLQEHIAREAKEMRRDTAASLRAVTQIEAEAESVLRRNLILAWIVSRSIIGIALVALFMEFRQRLKAEATLRASELDLQEKLQQGKEALRAEALESQAIHLRLMESEHRFRSIFEQAAVGLAHVSLEGVFIRVNDKLCEITGYPRRELTGKTIADVTHAADVGRFLEMAQALLRGDIPTGSMEKRSIRRDGEIVWANLSASLVRKPSGEPDYLIAVIQDVTPRKMSELLLQESERRFRWVVESSPVGIVEIGTSGSITAANEAFYNLLGWNAEDFAAEGMNLRRITPDDWLETSNDRVRQAARTGRATVFAKEYFRRDGSRVPILLGLCCQKTTGEAVAFVLDMSELKRTEQLLRATEQRFRLVVEAAPSAIIMAAADGRISLVNTEAERLFGYGREEMVGQPVEMLIPERFRLHHEGHRAAFLKTPEGRPMGARRDLFGIRKDGAEVPVEIGLSPVTTSQGMFVLATVVDITERKAAEAALRESARQLQLLADAMPQMVWTARPDGSPEYRNRRWYEYMELPHGALDADMDQLVHRDDLESMVATWRAAIASGLPYEFQARFRDRRGQTWRWHLNRALPIQDAHGRLVRWVGTSTDIHDHKQLSEELEHRVELRTADLKRSLVEKELLLKEVHHRVKNNLQIICSLLSMQITRGDNSSPAESTATAMEPIREAHHRVMSMAMIHEHFYQSATLEDLDFGEYAGSLARRLFQAYCVDPARIVLELSVEPIHLEMDQAIPSGLILNELVSNALKHAFGNGRSGRIHIVFRSLGAERVELSVRDTGAGLPEGFDLTKVRSLGLQVVQALTQQLDANLVITSDRGTTVALDWQLSRELAAEATGV